jgi:hypothetical protein
MMGMNRVAEHLLTDGELGWTEEGERRWRRERTRRE